MLTRSKIKMQQSIRHTQQDLPYFNNEEQQGNTYMYKQTKHQNSKVSNNYTEHSHFNDYNYEVNTKKNGFSRNQIMKQLKQEYEILKHLSIEDNIQLYPKKYDQQNNARISQSSSLSSSAQSKKSNRIKEMTVESPKFNSKQFQNVHLEKKQLEIVIANSMRKIEQLLNNQILLKKSIHQLKNQIQGKGGVHQEYQKTIKALQRTEEELQGELNKSYHQNEKSIQKIKELNEKIRFLQGEISNKDREIKQAFDEQRRIHQLLRIEKDRYLNIEIQCKTFKMEFDLLEKEKNNEMNRLIRQFESKQGGNQKQMAYIIKKLEEEIKEKDKKVHELLIERQHLKKQKDFERPVQKKIEKNYIQQLMYKSRQINESNNKALADSVNLIYQKMAELEKRNDEVLKRQIQALKKKPEENKRSVNQYEYTAKITQLERTIQRETSEKNRLIANLKNAEQQQYEMKNKYREAEKKWKDLQQTELQLRQEVKQLEEQLDQIKTHYNNIYEQQARLQEEASTYSQRSKLLQSEIEGHREYVNNLTASFKDKQKKYQDQIRVLRRKVDQAHFEAQKIRKQAQFNLIVLRNQHESQAKKLVQENARLAKRLKQVDQSSVNSRNSVQTRLRAKENEVQTLTNVIQTLKRKSQEDLNNQKQFYDSRLAAAQAKYSQDIKAFNDKFISISSSNEKLLSQISSYSGKDSQIIELRRLLRQSTTMTTTVSHLWDVKQAQYSNINDVLNSLRT